MALCVSAGVSGLHHPGRFRQAKANKAKDARQNSKRGNADPVHEYKKKLNTDRKLLVSWIAPQDFLHLVDGQRLCFTELAADGRGFQHRVIDSFFRRFERSLE